MSLHDELMADGGEVLAETLGGAELRPHGEPTAEPLDAHIGAVTIEQKEVSFGSNEKVRRVESCRVTVFGLAPDDARLSSAWTIDRYGRRPWTIDRVEHAGSVGVTLYLERPLLVRGQRSGSERRES